MYDVLCHRFFSPAKEGGRKLSFLESHAVQALVLASGLSFPKRRRGTAREVRCPLVKLELRSDALDSRSENWHGNRARISLVYWSGT